MRVERLSLINFRNYASLALEPGAGANALIGPNGAGKTNVLEALHLVATGLSHRATRDREMQRHGSDAFAVRARLARDEFPDMPSLHEVIFRDGRKTVKRDEKALTGRTRTEALGAAVVFAPDDLDLIKGSPAGRRRYLDMVIAKADARYRAVQRRYDAALAQRNRLLSEILPASSAGFCQLDPWTEQLIVLGAVILEYRLRCLDRLGPMITESYARIAGSVAETLTVEYSPSWQPADAWSPPASGRSRNDLEAGLRRDFAGSASEEVRRRISLAGPHRDDLRCSLNGVPIRVYGSQGQQRSAALGLRLAETAFLHQVRGERPLLLLDDVFSELDQARRSSLIELLGLDLVGRQTFLTATDLEGAPGLDGLQLAVFCVAGGSVTRGSPA